MTTKIVLWMGLLVALLGASASAQNLVVNGGFEDGLVGWALWDPAPSQGSSAWTRDAACYTAPTTPGCAFAGNGAYRHSGNGFYADGGVYQVVPVLPGRQYRISGQWRGGARVGGVSGSVFWGMTAYEGELDATMLSESTEGPSHSVGSFSFTRDDSGWSIGWLPFSSVIRVGHSSSSVTLALRHLSSHNDHADLYLDDVSMVLLDEPSQPIPVDSHWAALLLVAAVLGLGVRRMRIAASRSSP